MNGTTNRLAEINKRFQRETADHEMTVLHEDGLYRHLRFTPVPKPGKPRHSFYWFDLITVPGALIFQGDGDSFTFRRVEDMFEFFRGPVGRINPHYWSEKLTSGRQSVQSYRREQLEQHVNELIAETTDDGKGGVLPEFAGLADAVREQILDELIGDESIDRKRVEDFRWWATGADEFAWPPKRPDFEFIDVWEWDCRDYNWWFLWACHGIVWGIAQYDAKPAPSLTRRLRTRAAKLLAGARRPAPLPTKPAPIPQPSPQPKQQPEQQARRPKTAPRVITVHLPEPTESTEVNA